jgi:L-threonylcarbamoyladenylate synthase
MCFQNNHGTPIISDSNNNSINISVKILTNGGLIAFPTDTVYGIGALFTNTSAVKRMYDAKSRALNKAIPILVGNFSDAWSLAKDLSPSASNLAKAFWPGPLSIVVNKSDSVPTIVAPGSTVALRSPNHSWLLQLLNLVGPLAVSSANKSGKSESISYSEVKKSFGNELDLIVSGNTNRPSLPSTVVDCSVNPPKILREGPISSASIKTTM